MISARIKEFWSKNHSLFLTILSSLCHVISHIGYSVTMYERSMICNKTYQHSSKRWKTTTKPLCYVTAESIHITVLRKVRRQNTTFIELRPYFFANSAYFIYYGTGQLWNMSSSFTFGANGANYGVKDSQRLIIITNKWNEWLNLVLVEEEYFSCLKPWFLL